MSVAGRKGGGKSEREEEVQREEMRGRKKYRGKREDGGRRDRWSRGRGRREEVRGRREGREWREGGGTGAAGADSLQALWLSIVTLGRPSVGLEPD